MRLLVNKEIRLSTSMLSWIFIAFSLMTFLPGYPIAMGAFFVCLGIFQSFRKSRESHDVLFTVLLPIAKRDAVTAKYAIVLLIQGISFVLMFVFAVVRMTALADVPEYTQNVLLPANLTFISCVLLVYALFNAVFLRGFFKTAYNFGKPFVAFIVVSLLIILLFEVVWHFPQFSLLGSIVPNATQIGLLMLSLAVFALVTVLSLKGSQKSFEKLDI